MIKTMDYKEKLELAKDWYDDKSTTNKEKVLLENLFPELKMSEDERTRKELIDLIKDIKGQARHVECYDRYLAWLEKQGEPQPYRGNADTMRKNLIKAFKSVGSKHWEGFDVRDIIYFLESKDAIKLEKQGEKHIDGKLSNLLNRVICRFINDPYIPCSERDEVSNKIIPYVEQLEKQGEQKPMNWKPYDEETLEKIKELIDAHFSEHVQRAVFKRWLDEHISQPTKWSEEDEKIIETMCKEGDLRPSQRIWLKSLKNRVQPHWKPTDEQMNSLAHAIEDVLNRNDEDAVYDHEMLESLYNDLKKL